MKAPMLLLALGFCSMAVTDAQATETAPSIEPPLDVNLIRASTLSPEDGREITLAMPEYDKCQFRDSHAITVNASGKIAKFWISNYDRDQEITDPVTKKKVKRSYTWLEGRNHCRKKCMELVALDSPEKHRALVNLLIDLDIQSGVWTAGKRCLGGECDRVPEPIHLNGWYWSTTEERLHPADQTQDGWPENPWSDFGILDIPQPDNSENLADEFVIEACLAVDEDPYTNKLGWHDVACDIKLGIVCEPAPTLVKYIESTLNAASSTLT